MEAQSFKMLQFSKENTSVSSSFNHLSRLENFFLTLNVTAFLLLHLLQPQPPTKPIFLVLSVFNQKSTKSSRKIKIIKNDHLWQMFNRVKVAYGGQNKIWIIYKYLLS